MTNTYTWDVYTPFGVGLETIFNRLDSMSGHNTNYPPYNIIKNDQANYEIEVALAGFKAEEIEVSTEQNILRVTSKVEKRDSERTYLHKGLSKRSFSHSWQLADDVRVSNVDFADGLLSISLEKIIPEHQKKTVYKIGGLEIPVPQFLTEDRDSNFPNENTINNKG
jgi:molecular chaperone IbpA